MKHLKLRWSKLPPKLQDWRLLAVAVLVGISGTFMLMATHAATSTASFEAEDGTVTGSAAVANSSTASGGQYVKFGGGGTSVTYGPVPASAPSTAYVTPEQFGAVGNDTHDDTNAVQQALNAGAGKTVWFAANKTYRITSTLSIADNETVTGAGTTSVLHFAWEWTSDANSGGGVNLRTAGTSSSNFHVSNFVLKGGGSGLPSGTNATNPGGVPGFKIIKGTNFSVTHMEIYNTSGIGITYQGQGGLFQYNYVHNTGRDGITGYWQADMNLTDITVDSNYVYETGDDGICINGLIPGDLDNTALPLRIVISNNLVHKWETNPNGKALGRGICLNGARGAIVKNNTVEYPKGAGIRLTGCTPNFCSAGSTDPATGQPWLSSATITGNTIDHANSTDSDGGAIYITNGTNSTITGNTITNSAIHINNDSCTNCTVQAN